MIQLVQLALRPLLSGWGHRILRDHGGVPRPTDDPRSHASGVDSDRILLLGAGTAVGWGVASHDLALPGALARAVSTLTGRGVDVDVLAGPNFVAVDAIRRLHGVDLARYDAILLTYGLHEASRLSSLADWDRDLGALLGYLEDVVSPHAHVFVLGLHPTAGDARYNGILGPHLARHQAAMNQGTSQVCDASTHVTFIPVDAVQPGAGTNHRSVAGYRQSAAMVAARIAPVLISEFRRTSNPGSRSRDGMLDEVARGLAVDALGIVDTVQEERFDRIAAFARRAFHTSGAAITILDRERFWTKSSIGAPRSEGRREDSICFTTIDREDSLVIADASRDARFAGISRVAGADPVRFYAGHRIEAPNGVPVAVLCVYDPKSRDIAGFDGALLRDLALLAQKQLWVGSQVAPVASDLLRG
jgi:hypothetical protein